MEAVVITFPQNDDVIIKEPRGRPVISYAYSQVFNPELSVFPDLVWDKIFEYITDTNDIFALLNTSPYFHQKIMETETGLLPLVLPYIMKRSFLNLPSTLKCRLLNTTSKLAVDKTLREISASTRQLHGNENQGNTIFEEGPYLFKDVEKLNNFLDNFEGISLQSANPFLTDCLKLCVLDIDFYERVLQLLSRCGHLVEELYLSIGFINDPATLLSRLIRVLNRVPNLERLHFYFRGVPNDIENQEMFQLFPMPSAAEFPRLSRLVEFAQVQLRCFESWQPHPLTEATRTILEAYGEQLTRFECENEMFTLDIPDAFFSQQLTNLSELTLWSFQVPDKSHCNSIERLSRVQLPKLARLRLEFFGLREDSKRTSVSHTIVFLLNSLRNSLEELHLRRHGRGVAQFKLARLNPSDTLLALPKLRKISVEPPDLKSNLWPIFEAQARNLVCLEFRRREYDRLHWILETLPMGRLKRFFSRFPILDQIIWKDLSRHFVRKTVIKRVDLQQGRSRVEFEPTPYR